jgi:hypothetical protein
MFRTANHCTSSRRRIGVLVFSGAAAGLVTLAVGSGSAAASPDGPYVPRMPSIISDEVALNPQPLPPGPGEKLGALNPQSLSPGSDFSKVALNPQPLPPRSDFSRVALNPQPLPPGPGPNWTRLFLPRLGF